MSYVEARLEALAQSMGVNIVETSKLGSFLNACFHSPTRNIIVRTGLDPVTRVCAIAHELGHAHYGHNCSNSRAEREADEWSAQQLLTVGIVEDTAVHCDGAPAAIAAELGITPHLLTVWMNLYTAGRTTSYNCLSV